MRNQSTTLAFQVNGRRLLADVRVPGGKTEKPFVMFLHDPHTGATQAPAVALAKRGYGTFSVYMDGVTVDASMLAAAYDAMFLLPQVDATQIFAVDYSDAGLYGAELARERPLAGLALQSSAWSQSEASSMRLLSSLRRLGLPVLVVPEINDGLVKTVNELTRTLREWIENRTAEPALG